MKSDDPLTLQASDHAPMAGGSGNVLVYRSGFLALSETFIKDHLSHLQRWRPVAAYESRVKDGLSVEPITTTCIRPSGPRRITGPLYRKFGINRRFSHVVDQEHISLVHVHFLTNAVHIMRAVKRERLPLIVTAHGYDATTYDEELVKSFDGKQLVGDRKALIKSVSLILCVSDFIKKELIERGYPASKLRTLPLGIDRSLYSPGPLAGRRRGALFAGRLVAKKGVHLLLEAWATMSPTARSQGLTVIGAGPEMDRLSRAAAGFPEITFLGAQPREVVRAAMLSHRVFVFPSMRAPSGDAEGMGVVGMEAQALGLPVVAFDDGPGPELVRDSESGLIVKAADLRMLATAVEAVLTSDELADRLSAGGPRHVAAKFDLHDSIEKLERVYDDVARGHRRS